MPKPLHAPSHDLTCLCLTSSSQGLPWGHMVIVPVLAPPRCGNILPSPSCAVPSLVPVGLLQAETVPYAKVGKMQARLQELHCFLQATPLIPVLVDAASSHIVPKLPPIFLVPPYLGLVCVRAYIRACVCAFRVCVRSHRVEIVLFIEFCPRSAVHRTSTLEVKCPVLHSNCERTIILVVYSYYGTLQAKASPSRTFLHFVLRL